MNKVYIGLEDAIEALEKHEDYKGYLQGDYEQILREEVEPADVKPVVRGEWKLAWVHYDCSSPRLIGVICSLCGGRSDFETNFCPNCGADTRGMPCKE